MSFGNPMLNANINALITTTRRPASEVKPTPFWFWFCSFVGIVRKGRIGSSFHIILTYHNQSHSIPCCTLFAFPQSELNSFPNWTLSTHVPCTIVRTLFVWLVVFVQAPCACTLSGAVLEDTGEKGC